MGSLVGFLLRCRGLNPIMRVPILGVGQYSLIVSKEVDYTPPKRWAFMTALLLKHTIKDFPTGALYKMVNLIN